MPQIMYMNWLVLSLIFFSFFLITFIKMYFFY